MTSSKISKATKNVMKQNMALKPNESYKSYKDQPPSRISLEGIKIINFPSSTYKDQP